MKILISGASGLVGRNLAEELQKEYYLLTPTHGEVDLTSYESVVQFLAVCKPDMIIHCAGKVGGIQANIANPVSFFVENMDMGRNIVLAAKELGIKKLINLGSSCMYPRNAHNPLQEDMVLQGELEPTNEGYALAKIATQRLCAYIESQYPTFSYKTLIPCNLYGLYDKFDLQHSHMIPAVIRKIHEAKIASESAVEIWGDGTARREFMHVSDLVSCIKKVIQEYDRCPSLMNVGLGCDYTINEYYETIAKVIGYDGSFYHNKDKPVGMKQKVVDVTRLNEFGWCSHLSLEEGLALTYDYFLSSGEVKR